MFVSTCERACLGVDRERARFGGGDAGITSPVMQSMRSPLLGLHWVLSAGELVVKLVFVWAIFFLPGPLFADCDLGFRGARNGGSSKPVIMSIRLGLSTDLLRLATLTLGCGEKSVSSGSVSLAMLLSTVLVVTPLRLTTGADIFGKSTGESVYSGSLVTLSSMGVGTRSRAHSGSAEAHTSAVAEAIGDEASKSWSAAK